MFNEIQFSSLPEGQDINVLAQKTFSQAQKNSCKYNEFIKDFHLPEEKVQ